jgi:hypothetical protein
MIQHDLWRLRLRRHSRNRYFYLPDFEALLTFLNGLAPVMR